MNPGLNPAVTWSTSAPHLLRAPQIFADRSPGPEAGSGLIWGERGASRRCEQQEWSGARASAGIVGEVTLGLLWAGPLACRFCSASHEKVISQRIRESAGLSQCPVAHRRWHQDMCPGLPSARCSVPLTTGRAQCEVSGDPGQGRWPSVSPRSRGSVRR